MQTFHVYTNHGKTARALDDKRLGKQRVECLQTLNQITLGEGGFPHHPVNRMWEGYEFALAVYGMLLCIEWTQHRRCADTIFWELEKACKEMHAEDPDFTYVQPPWFRDTDVMRSHRSNLIRKQDEGTVTGRDYRELFPKTPERMPYLWPFVNGEGGYDLMIDKANRQRLKDGERKCPRSILSRVANL